MSGVLWTRDAVVLAVGGEALGADWSAMGVSIDSRTLEPGDLFVAIHGDKSDGHGFVDAAFKAGAVAALVSEVTPAMKEAGPLVCVDDTLAALNGLARAARARCGARRVAVTGSVGKTGTKDMLRQILSRQGRTHASVASYNNQWGVPLSLARMPADTAYGIFEVGMNHAGEIRPLTKLLEPDIAIVTTVEPVHLAFFASVEEIADAKGEIFEGLRPGGVAILNRDNPHFDRLRLKAAQSGTGRIIGFGAHETADARVLKIVLHEHCSCVAADICGQAMTFKVGVPGRHMVMNSLAVLACVAALDGDLALAALELAAFAAPRGRGARHQVAAVGRTFTLIDESYNANPASMQAAFEALGRVEPGKRGRRIAVLGDMLELGVDAPALHRALATPFLQAKADLLFACGPHMQQLFDAIPAERRGLYAARSQDLLAPLVDEIRDGDVVMIKGSFGSQMGLLVDGVLELGEDRPDAAHTQSGGR